MGPIEIYSDLMAGLPLRSGRASDIETGSGKNWGTDWGIGNEENAQLSEIYDKK